MNVDGKKPMTRLNPVPVGTSASTSFTGDDAPMFLAEERWGQK
jgi:hypothetical protein